MIHETFTTEIDAQCISKIPESFNKELDNFDFSEAIVIKPWGREYLAYKGEMTDIWILHLNNGNMTSMHCHANKKTILIVLSGEVSVSTLDKNFELEEGDVIVFEKGKFHSTTAISKNGAMVMELESPPQKTDLLRLKDNYGREKRGYELKKEMCFDLSKYERTFLKGDDLHKKFGNMSISIKKFEDIESVKNYLHINKRLINILISGEIEIDEKIVHQPGDIFNYEKINFRDDMKMGKDIRIINIQRNIFDLD